MRGLNFSHGLCWRLDSVLVRFVNYFTVQDHRLLQLDLLEELPTEDKENLLSTDISSE